MKRFLMSVLLILTMFFAIDRIGGMIMAVVCEHTESVIGPKLNHLVNGVDEDVLLLGTSRCHFHYVPRVISNSLGMSVYNGGIDASNNIFSHYMALCYVLAHHRPKVVCLELMTADFESDDDAVKTIRRFSPYYGRTPRADSLFAMTGMRWKYELSHLYRYNATSLANLTGLIQNLKIKEDHGYCILNTSGAHKPTMTHENPPQKIDTLKLQYLERFISLCSDSGIDMVFMVSPKYTKVSHGHYDILKDIARKNHIPFLDYHTTGLFHDYPEYFKDEGHLCDKGARIYSAIFAGDLKHILQSTN